MEKEDGVLRVRVKRSMENVAEKSSMSNVLLPWGSGENLATSDDAAAVAAFLEIVMPLAVQFDPDFTLISYDSESLQGEIGRVSSLACAFMVKMLRGFADGRVLLVMNGVLGSESFYESLRLCCQGLLDHALPPFPVSNHPSRLSPWKMVEQLKANLGSHWLLLDTRVHATGKEDQPSDSNHNKVAPSLLGY